MTETNLTPPNPSLEESILNPNVSLGELLTYTGLEGLSQEARLATVERATLDDYKAAASAIHRKVAAEHSHEENADRGKLTNPSTGEVSNYTAHPEERDMVLSKALENAKLVAAKYRKEGGSLEDALQRCGSLAAFGLVLAHVYKDGNGRTARTMAELIYKGYDGESPESVQDLAVVSAKRPDKGFRINSYVPTGEWSDRANEHPLKFLDVVAALEQPLDGQSYTNVSSEAFTAPRA